MTYATRFHGTGTFARKLDRVRQGTARRLRRLIYSLGSQVECCYCGWTGSQFLPAGADQMPNRLCPRCGSIERYRMLYLYLADEGRIFRQPIRLLDTAPRTCFTRFCQNLPNVTYVSSDLMASGTMVLSDLAHMGMASHSFDIITCLHVFEHIQNDDAAFSELGRLLKPGGFALLMVPLSGEETFEDPLARPEDYKRLYGQHDHVRLYGMDIVDRIKATGLQVETIDMFRMLGPEILQRHALHGDDRYFFRISR